MSHLETWLSNGTYTAAAICCSSAASTPARFCCSSLVKLSAVSFRLTNTDSTWPLCCMPAGTAAEIPVILHGILSYCMGYWRTAWILSHCADVVILHGYCHTAWMLSYCMDTVTLHGCCHTAWILSHCMDVVILHGYYHTAWMLSYCMDTVILHAQSLLGAPGVSLLHACRFIPCAQADIRRLLKLLLILLNNAKSRCSTSCGCRSGSTDAHHRSSELVAAKMTSKKSGSQEEKSWGAASPPGCCPPLSKPSQAACRQTNVGYELFSIPKHLFMVQKRHP